MRTRLLAALAAATLSTGTLLAVSTSPAAASTVTDLNGINSALSSCTGTAQAPTQVTLAGDISAPGHALQVGCVATLDLASHDLSVLYVMITAGNQLTIDGNSDGKLTADASSSSLLAGIANTDATLIINGGTIHATGGTSGAGIGGGSQTNDWYTHGGHTIINGGTVHAQSLEGSGIGGGILSNGGVIEITGGTTYATSVDGAGIGGGLYGHGADVTIGPGALVEVGSVNGSAIGSGETEDELPPWGFYLDFGSLTVNGTLRLRTGFMHVPDSISNRAEIVVGPRGLITADLDPPGTRQFIGKGQIDNHGVILLPQEHVLGTGPTQILDHHYLVSFDTRGGSPTPSSVVVLATSLQAGARDLPSDPTRAGHVFAGWNTAADGSGTTLTPTTALPGGSTDGTAAPVTAYAQWHQKITGLAPLITGTPREGGTLTATPGPVTPITGVSYTHQWYANGKPISGAKTSKLKLTKAQAGRRITVRVTATADHVPAVTTTSAPTRIISSKHKRIVLSKTSVKKGHSFVVTATGFKAKQKVRIRLDNKTRWTGRADAYGVVNRTVTFKSDTKAGRRSVKVQYKSGSKYKTGISTSIKYYK